MPVPVGLGLLPKSRSPQRPTKPAPPAGGMRSMSVHHYFFRWHIEFTAQHGGEQEEQWSSRRRRAVAHSPSTSSRKSSTLSVFSRSTYPEEEQQKRQ
jgi:hypothetical protein